MPGRNLVKFYKPDSYYHIYNRGVEKRILFIEQADYYKFSRFLRDSLLKTKVELVCFCLMSNHFHFLIFQRNPKDIENLMRSLGTKYALYFNYKYDRVGHLFQSSYRARLIKDSQDLLNTSAYIHNNPRKDISRIILKKYEYCSYKDYFDKNTSDLINKNHILGLLNISEYKVFVENKRKEALDLG